MQKGQAPILILVGILIIAVAGGAYYLGTFKNVKLQSQNPVVTSIQVSASPVSSSTFVASSTPISSDETANWKIYINSQFGFSVKYPPSWILHEYSVDKTYRLVSIVITNKEKDINLSSDGNPKIGFVIEINTSLHDKKIFERSGEDKAPNFVGFNYQQTTMLALPAAKAYTTYSDMIPDIGISWLYFNKDSHGWLLGWPNTDFKGHYVSVYDQILSTFKFTN